MASSSKSKTMLDYEPPHENVLLISCMDLRLLDDIVTFMNGDNLCNRYDHLVFAGAALGATGVKKGSARTLDEWYKTFIAHLDAAKELHEVKDVYILEHRACGAYTKKFHIHDLDASPEVELDWHAYYATLLEKDINQWSQANNWPLTIHKFMMDLRGQVTLLPDKNSPPTKGSKNGGKKKK
ncbi:hypothetical protein [Lacipirellula parvula]|uniref:Carbonic anhydrase n=1 Tax=Lacipirellula parvula TaxID=2650471 RepID=A0A5K7XBV4_9BACT|nr:hypothetical protein [Lacipirellula parvula]BBO34304.1 hypothetical protein PLANPX_3916 [Lacipirellula parvula]